MKDYETIDVMHAICREASGGNVFAYYALMILSFVLYIGVYVVDSVKNFISSLFNRQF